MTLRDAIRDLPLLDDEATIYARRPWTAGAEATVEREPDEGGLPPEARRLGLEYFLEVSVANEVLDGWAAREAKPPGLDARCARVIRYAETDA